ncbi:MAG TPA: hypothetical protein VD834_12265 [Blastococcus sp.]|nr:hypothetical protein [Blastococcus sp.]
MGRHSAAGGASAHPIAVAALAQRAAAVSASPEGGSVGWPSPPGPESPERGGGGLGWPGGSEEDAQDRTRAQGPGDAVPARRGRRRLFGAA